MACSIETAMGYLSAAWSHGRLSHAYLVSGSSRDALESLAVRLIGLVKGEIPASLDAARRLDVQLVRPESKSRRIKVGQIRDLERWLFLAQGRNQTKVAVLCDVDRWSDESANAFLKTLEEPPPRTLLVLLTLHPERLLDTIRSRCIRLALATESEVPEPGSDRHELLRLAARFANDSPDSLAKAFAFKSALHALLADARARAVSECEAELEEETDAYAKTTDGAWLEQREEHYKALAEARYLEGRAELLSVLESFFGDALRHRVGGDRLDLASFAEESRRLASTVGTDELLRRIAVVDRLRRHLETNAQEALVLESACLRLFAGA